LFVNTKIVFKLIENLFSGFFLKVITYKEKNWYQSIDIATQQ